MFRFRKDSGFRLGSVWVAALALTALWATGAPGQLLAQQVIAGKNVNIVGGPASIDAGPPLSIQGDPFLQRQNEPSMACSSRNPLTCLAGANDYRLVNVPGLPDGNVTGDAWLGVFWTRDDGQTWRSTAFPGFPQDTSPEGLSSPVKGLAAAADPTVRAGTSGLFYYSGIAFTPASSSTAGSAGSEGKAGVMFVSVFIDDNNTQDVNTPPRYIRNVILDDGTSGQFLDKPWIATDIPRPGGGECVIPGSNGVPDQTVPAGNVYAAYSVFTGSGNNAHSKLLFARSFDCGATWQKPVRLDASTDVSQSATISVNPQNGDVLVAWRAFSTPNDSAPGQILVVRSKDYGRSFSQATEVANLGYTTTSVAFDQSTLPDASVPNGNLYRMFRTNGYPTMCTSTGGVARIAWAQRGIGPQGDARIVVSTSTDGKSWSAPVPVDNHPGRGHQLMPALACTATTASLAWYDQRDDNAAALLGATAFGPLIWDLIPPPPAHTLDVRSARAVGNAAFGPSTKVSRYQFALDTTSVQLIQLQFNPVNWPLFSGGQLPFIGDYIDMVPASPFKPPVGSNNWTYNTDTTSAPVFHATWTDNRDIVPSLGDLWGSWGPPGTGACTQPTIRNQNVYTSRLSSGLVVGTGGNSRLAGTIARAYAVFAQNATSSQRRFKFETGIPPGGPATFKFGQALTQLEADVPPFSTVARTVFVSGTGAAVVRVTEISSNGTVVPGGLTATTLINSDPTAPPPDDSSVITGELHTIAMSDAFINEYLNPTFLNPTFLNPTFLNPTFLNPTFLNPTFLNPTFLNPTFLNPTFLNPTFLNPTFLNPTFLNAPLVTDLSWQVTNEGNVVSGYNFNAILASLPADAVFQLIVNRVYNTPGSADCSLGEQVNADLLLNVQNPSLTLENNLSSSASNATFVLASGDTAVVTLRAVHTGNFNPDDVTVVLTAQAEDTNGGTPQVIIDKAPPVVTVPADITKEAAGPSGAIVTYNGVSAVDGLDGAVVTTCTPASGSLFPVGQTTVTCTATDAHGNTGTATFVVIVEDTEAPVIAPQADITVEATGASGAVVTYAAPATTDAVDGPGTATCSPASGSQFAVGDTTVTCTATDSQGNTATSSFAVHVTDTTGPSVAAMSDITTEAVSAAGATVIFATPAATDAVDGSVAVSCSPTSGGVFPLGTTTVTCSATDSQGNTGSTTFGVHVLDTTAPIIGAHADITVAASSAAGAVVVYASPATTDAVDGAGVASCSPASGSNFAIGTTTVTCTATDTHGNVAAATSFAVTVLAPTVSPTLTLPAPISVITPDPAGAVVSYAATATDAFGTVLTPVCSPVSGALFAPGTTTVNCTATDAFGNFASGSFTVTVTVVIPLPQYGFIGVQNLPPANSKPFKAGSSVPLQWQFTLNGVVVDSSDALPEIRIVGASGEMIFRPEDPGSSAFQPPTAQNGYTWQFNWQSSVPPGSYDVYVGSRKSGQTFVNGTSFGPFTINIR